jgi:hypothetical protein
MPEFTAGATAQPLSIAASVDETLYLQPSNGFARVTLKSHNGFIDLKVSPQ